jgi:hypothetical protein
MNILLDVEFILSIDPVIYLVLFVIRVSSNIAQSYVLFVYTEHSEAILL